MKKLLFALYQKIVNLLWGTGLGRFRPISWLYGWLFLVLAPKEGIMVVGENMMYSRMYGLHGSYGRTFQAYLMRGGWEEETTRLFKEVVKVGDTVVDMGANIGYYTLLAARIVGPSGKVYCFEPDPSNYSLLTGNIKLNKFENIIAEQKAVSNTNGRLKFYLDKKDTGGHTLYKSDKFREIVEIDSVSLDSYFSNMVIPINVIKMDIEGAEPYAFLGMSNLIKKNKKLKIFMEFHRSWIERAGVSPWDFAGQLFDDYKFSITVIQDYKRNVKSSKVNNLTELLDLCRNEVVVNLLLER